MSGLYWLKYEQMVRFDLYLPTSHGKHRREY